MSNSPTVADLLVQRLRQHGVTHIFGYPGGQLTPIYDALYRDGGIRHVLARDEQAAAFMADGYARATGNVGVCLAVCGPGFYNASTALATSFTDSIPVLCISGQVPTAGLGLRSGYYHENDQLHASTSFTKWRGRATSAPEVMEALDQAMDSIRTARPGPALLEVPLDVQRGAWTETPLPTLSLPTFPPPAREEVDALARLLFSWKKPLLLAGGGVVSAGASLQFYELAERLGAPVLHTLNGKSAFPADHPLHAGMTWRRATSDVTAMEDLFSPLFAEADGLFALGCRFTQAATGNWALKPPAALAQVDVDANELGRHYPVTLGIAADVAETLGDLLPLLPVENRPPWAPPRQVGEPWRLPGIDLVGPLRCALPRDGIVVADITRLSYILLAEFPTYLPRTFLHPSGFVTMGYGIPAALGAKTAFPDRPVVAVVGDGCFQMCGMELATAVQEKLPIVVVLINDNCLTLIKATQERRYEGRLIGVELQNPDFVKFAEAFGVRAWRVTDDNAFETALREALALNAPALIEVRLS